MHVLCIKVLHIAKLLSRLGNERKHSIFNLLVLRLSQLGFSASPLRANEQQQGEKGRHEYGSQ